MNKEEVEACINALEGSKKIFSLGIDQLSRLIEDVKACPDKYQYEDVAKCGIKCLNLSSELMQIDAIAKGYKD